MHFETHPNLMAANRFIPHFIWTIAVSPKTFQVAYPSRTCVVVKHPKAVLLLQFLFICLKIYLLLFCWLSFYICIKTVAVL